MRFGLWFVAALLSLAHAGASASTLADKLLSADYVLLMRHAYAPGVGDPPGYSLDRCETQRNLDEQGKRQAVRAGQWLRQQGIHQAQVMSSVWCRCQQTAELLAYGPVTIEPSLASFFDTPERAEKQNQAMHLAALNNKSLPQSPPAAISTELLEISQENDSDGSDS